MKNAMQSLFIALIFLVPCTAFSQDITGLWEVSKVMVGEETMTPQGKWTRFKPDSTYASGNGWLQHSQGTWSFNAFSNLLWINETHGPADEYGAFEVKFNGPQMLWERNEEGMQVTVVLDRTDELPMTPADKLTGLWDLIEAKRNGESVTAAFDPDDNYYIFFRWDRRFVKRTTDGKRDNGYWQMHAHQPELTMISENCETGMNRFTVAFLNGNLILTEKENPLKLEFVKISGFPE